MRFNPKTQYFNERLLKAMSELFVTNSHQSVLIKTMLDLYFFADLRIHILSSFDFPSGFMYHHNHTYIADIEQHRLFPFVFHMCWTASREEKVGVVQPVSTYHPLTLAFPR